MGNVDGGWKEFDVRKAGVQSKSADVGDEVLNA
jgi:hypothetical protein